MTIKALSARGATRSEIARLLGVTEGAVRYHARRMASGAVDGRSRQPSKAAAMVLMVTLKTGALSAGDHYDGRFIDAQTFAWHTQTQTKRESRHGRIVSGREAGWTVHLFVRSGKLRNGVSAPFRHCGPLAFISWEDEGPIAVTSQLTAPVPPNLRQVMGIE